MQARALVVATIALWALRACSLWGLLSLALMAIGADRTTAYMGAFLWIIVMAPMFFLMKKRRRNRKD